jgi:hypothetical protein
VLPPQAQTWLLLPATASVVIPLLATWVTPVRPGTGAAAVAKLSPVLSPHAQSDPPTAVRCHVLFPPDERYRAAQPQPASYGMTVPGSASLRGGVTTPLFDPQGM